MSLSKRIHMWFIRLITKQVELVTYQMTINKLLEQVQDSMNLTGIPRVYIGDKTMAQHKPTKTKRSGNGSKRK